jgi:hypothetical protein
LSALLARPIRLVAHVLRLIPHDAPPDIEHLICTSDAGARP